MKNDWKRKLAKNAFGNPVYSTFENDFPCFDLIRD
jgi:hypothetical protein